MTEQLKLARKALARLGLIGRPIERERRPTQDELDHITAYLDGNPRQVVRKLKRWVPTLGAFLLQ